MLQLLRANNPSIVLLNLLLVIGVRLYAYYHPPTVDDLYLYAEPLSRYFIGLVGLPTAVTLPYWLIAGGVVSFVESLFVNYLINTHKVTTRKNYLGGVIFILLTCFSAPLLYLSPVHIAVCIELLLFHRLLSLNRPDRPYTSIYDLGFWSGVAMLFYFPSAIFLLFSFFALYTMRPLSIRESVMVVLGFATIVFATIVFYVWHDHLGVLGFDLINFAHRQSLSFSTMLRGQIVIIGSILVWALVAFGLIPRLLFSSAIQTRKQVTLFVAAFAMCIVATLLQSHYGVQHLLLCMPPLIMVYTLYLMETRSRYMGEIVLAVLIVTVGVLLYSPWTAVH